MRQVVEEPSALSILMVDPWTPVPFSHCKTDFQTQVEFYDMGGTSVVKDPDANQH